MPGSANFIGEFYILNGLFDSKIVFAIVAISGVAMSAYYALRLYQRTMHNRRPEGLESREIGWRDGLVLAPLVLCIVGLALYPQLILKRTDQRPSQAERSAHAVRQRAAQRFYGSGEASHEHLQRPRDGLRGALAGHRADRRALRRPPGRRLRRGQAGGAGADDGRRLPRPPAC